MARIVLVLKPREEKSSRAASGFMYLLSQTESHQRVKSPQSAAGYSVIHTSGNTFKPGAQRMYTTWMFQ